MQSKKETENWGIYVHVPWCRRRCPYCDFYFEVGKPDSGFAQAIIQELNAYRLEWPLHPASTLYFGGGTPSLLPTLALQEIIAYLRHEVPLAVDAEITLEANPEDLDRANLEAIFQAGVGRLSLGVQSFSAKTLRYLGRKHTPEQAKNAVLWAQEIGFKRLSVDLIIGVPEQPYEEIKNSLDWLYDNGVTHISVYILTLEEQAPLGRLITKGIRQNIDDDAQADAYEQVQQLTSQKWRQYEISSYAKPGFESQHNRIYWAQGQYLGLGPGAHSMLRREDGFIVRRHTFPSLQKWLKDPCQAKEEEVLNPQQALREQLAFGLRDLAKGISPMCLAKRHQTELPKDLGRVIDRFIDDGWLRRSEEQIFLTPLGARFADAIAREILILP